MAWAPADDVGPPWNFPEAKAITGKRLRKRCWGILGYAGVVKADASTILAHGWKMAGCGGPSARRLFSCYALPDGRPNDQQKKARRSTINIPKNEASAALVALSSGLYANLSPRRRFFRWMQEHAANEDGDGFWWVSERYCSGNLIIPEWKRRERHFLSSDDNQNIIKGRLELQNISEIYKVLALLQSSPRNNISFLHSLFCSSKS